MARPLENPSPDAAAPRVRRTGHPVGGTVPAITGAAAPGVVPGRSRGGSGGGAGAVARSRGIPPTDARNRRISDALEAWFVREARDLPWRRGRTAWSALVAELMLQQTQVSRVVPAFDRFMARFPAPADLARADDETLLTHWAGLGYYRRARLLRAAAAHIDAVCGGTVPRDASALRRLPGVGRYTAGAIASIVFGAREAIVDGNVTRVLARLEARRERADDDAGVRWTWARAESLVRASASPGVFNEALMELGATVCTRAQPACTACPLRRECRAAGLEDAGAPASIPPPKPAAVRRPLHIDAVAVIERGRILLERRPESGLWAGLWQMPARESSKAGGHDALLRWTRDHLPGWRPAAAPLHAFPHATTHRAVVIRVWRGERQATGSGRDRVSSDRVWQRLTVLDERPMSSAHRRAIEHAVALLPAGTRRDRGSA